jgi:hypothetical protein
MSKIKHATRGSKGLLLISKIPTPDFCSLYTCDGWKRLKWPDKANCFIAINARDIHPYYSSHVVVALEEVAELPWPIFNSKGSYDKTGFLVIDVEIDMPSTIFFFYGDKKFSKEELISEMLRLAMQDVLQRRVNKCVKCGRVVNTPQD